MEQRMQKILSKVSRYLADFKSKGFDRTQAEEVRQLLRQEEDTPIDRIFRVFACDDFDRCTLALALLAAVSPQAAGTIAGLCGRKEGCLTAGLVSAVFFGWEDVLPFAAGLMKDSPLDHLMDGVSLRQNAPMSMKEYAVCFALTGRIREEAFLLEEEDDVGLLPLQAAEQAKAELLSFLGKADRYRPFLLQILGEKGSGRRTVWKQVCRTLGEPYLPIGISQRDTRLRVREIADEMLLLGALPAVIADGGCSGEETAEFLRKLSDEVGLVIAVTEEELTYEDSLTVRLKRPGLSEQYRLWEEKSRSCQLAENVDFAELTGEFEMTPQEIGQALRNAALLSDHDELTLADLKNGCYRTFASDMGGKAVRLDCVFGWDDIVLPERSRRKLREACDQVRLRHTVYHHWGFQEKLPYGRGVSMIFTGPPGTGKTMGALVLAKELGMDIYRVSLANVVSKYIGETEKNLNEIFEKARRCRVILFFDEADVLFSKRTEVKDSNDKYSNMESAFLLQKMEEYNGAVILATNFVQNFDEAFKRRMRFIIDFPFPDASQRRELWRRVFPDKTPLSDIDWDYLTEAYELSGGNIKNIALHSAFLAASENSPAVTMKHILLSVRSEFNQIGKTFTRAEAGEYGWLLSE